MDASAAQHHLIWLILLAAAPREASFGRRPPPSLLHCAAGEARRTLLLHRPALRCSCKHQGQMTPDKTVHRNINTAGTDEEVLLSLHRGVPQKHSTKSVVGVDYVVVEEPKRYEDLVGRIMAVHNRARGGTQE